MSTVKATFATRNQEVKRGWRTLNINPLNFDFCRISDSLNLKRDSMNKAKTSNFYVDRPTFVCRSKWVPTLDWLNATTYFNGWNGLKQFVFFLNKMTRPGLNVSYFLSVYLLVWFQSITKLGSTTKWCWTEITRLQPKKAPFHFIYLCWGRQFTRES